MGEVRACPQGHQWAVAPDAAPNRMEQPAACPVCGLPGDTLSPPADSLDDSPDELPPLPAQPVDLSTLKTGLDPVALPPGPAAVPGYEILGELGRGGMGVVYKARQLSLNRVVALKMILAGPHAGTDMLRRFRAEAEAIARLPHANIVHVYDIMDCQGLPCFSMEYVAGQTLQQRLAGRPLPPGEAARLTATLARAVQAAHERGVIHRDLKPANVLLAADGTPKITDFGLAKRLDDEGVRTGSGQVMGTPRYMAPEQAEGDSKRIGPATDVHALGVILYELLTGRPPFRGENATQTLKQVLFDQPTPPGRLQPGLPPWLEAVCLKCLAKDPARRYASAGELAAALEQGAATTTKTARPAPAAPGGRRAWLLAGALGLALVGLLALIPPVRNWFFSAAPPTNPGGLAELRWEVLAGPPADPDEAFDRIAFPTRDTGYLASRKAVYKTRDGGKTWKKLKVENASRVHVLFFTDAQTGWLGTDRLRRTQDGGETWTEVKLGTPMRAVTAFELQPGGLCIAGGTDADGKLALFRSADTDTQWQKIDSADDLKPYESWYLGAVAVTGPAEALAVLFEGVSGGGVVLRTADAGKTWAKVFADDEDLYRLHLNNKGQGWLTGFGGALWHKADGAWRPHANPDRDGATPTCLAFDPQGKLGLAPLWKGKVLVKREAADWTVHDVPLGYSLPHAVVVDAGCAYVLAADGKVARLWAAADVSGK